MTSGKLKPALLGGVALGVLSALPIVNAGNVCCCLWVVSGGLLAAYLLQAEQPTPISAGDGAAVGLLAGLIGAVVWQVLAIPVDLMFGPLMQRFAERVLSSAGDLPENVRPMFESMRQGTGFGILRFLVGLVFTLVVSVAFSTVGGLIGAAMFAKKAPAAEPPADGPAVA
jgi:hypothetical protein